MKYVKCTNCGEELPLGTEIVLWHGYVGVFCSKNCAYDHYASSCIHHAMLSENIAEEKGEKLLCDLKL